MSALRLAATPRRSVLSWSAESPLVAAPLPQCPSVYPNGTSLRFPFLAVYLLKEFVTELGLLNYNRVVLRAIYMELSFISANELARLCAETGREDAWREFVRRFQRPIALSVLRTARSWGQSSSTLVDDLVQEVFLRLCADDSRLLRNFVPREPDSIIGYLKVLAANVTHDKLRNEKAVKRGGSFIFQDTEPADLDGLVAAPAGANAVEKSIRRREIDQALRSFVPQLITDRDRTIFWLYFEQGFSAREIGEIASIGLTVKGVESSIHRTTQQVREALLRHPVAFPAKGNPGPSAILKEEP